MKRILALVYLLCLTNTVNAQTEMSWFDDISICESSTDTTINFPNSISSDSTFTWYFNNLPIFENSDSSITISNNGEYTLYVYNTNNNTFYSTFNLTIDPSDPDFMLTFTDTELDVDTIVEVCLEDMPTLITPNDGYVHYWYIDGIALNDSLSDRTLVLQDIIDEIDFNYEHQFTVEYENLCGIFSARNIVTTKINECDCALNMPTVFTPNGDEYNNEFKPLNDHENVTEVEDMCKSTDFSMEIYSQWGRHMATVNSGDEMPRWDGISKGGNEVPEGVYYYQIDYKINIHTKPTQKQMTGFFHLYR